MAAFADFTTYFHESAVDFGQLFYDGESDAGPAAFFIPGFIRPIKVLEDERKIGRRDAAAGVPDFDLQPVLIFVRNQPGADADFAVFRRIADRVGQQVIENLADPPGIERNGGNLRQVFPQGDVFLQCQRFQHVDGPVNQLADIGSFFFKGKLPGFRQGQVAQILDHAA